MEKIHIDKMSNKQLEYSFIKVAGMLLGGDSAFIKMPTQLYTVWHLTNLNILNNTYMLNHILNLKNMVIDVKKEESFYSACYKEIKAIGETQSMALIKCFLFINVPNGYVEIPKNIK